MSHTVLVAEDDATTRYLIEQYCLDQPFDLTFASDGIEAMQRIKEADFDIMVTDVRLPGVSGGSLLSFMRETHPEVPVIVITGYGTIDGAVTFLQSGAFDYITKPFTAEVFTHRLSLASRNLELNHEVKRLRKMHPTPGLSTIQSADPEIVRLLSRLPSIAKTDASVVIYGESGTGKELFSRAVHELSPRASKPFVSVSCAALPETLIESELFGHVRGAFTDAHRTRIGLIEEAESGTLFLDEVGELPLAVQAKLLRFLQEREIKAVGSNEIRHADVRVVSATNRNLAHEVSQGTFREDLYYRLNVVPIHLPPLRDRRIDIPVLANHFLKRFAEEFECKVTGFAPELVSLMTEYRWPGNVRELMNRIERMIVVSDESVLTREAWDRSMTDSETLHAVSGAAPDGFTEEKRRIVARFEVGFITDCLRRTDGNIAKAARAAKLDRKNFWQLMKRHDIDADEFRLKGQPTAKRDRH